MKKQTVSSVVVGILFLFTSFYYIPNIFADNHAPSLSGIGGKEVDPGTVVQFNVLATDADGDAVAITMSNNPPPNATLSATTWDPALNKWKAAFYWVAQNGVWPNVRFTATDSQGASSYIEVDFCVPIQPPTLDPIPNQDTSEGQNLLLTITANDPYFPNDSLTFSPIDFPLGAWVKKNSNGYTASFHWRLYYGQHGTYTAGVRVTDQAGRSAEQYFTITVDDVTGPPVVNSIGNRTITVGNELRFSVSAYDPDFPDQQVQLSAENLPAGAQFEDIGLGRGFFSWTPTSDDLGLHQGIRFKATAGNEEDFEDITIAVNLENPASVVEIRANNLPIDLTQPGKTYKLMENIDYAGSPVPLEIKADDITLDGNGHTLTITNQNSTVYAITTQTTGVRNFMLRNLTIRNAGKGGTVYLFNSTKCAIISNDILGLGLYDSSQNVVYNNKLTGFAVFEYGSIALGSHYNILDNNIVFNQNLTDPNVLYFGGSSFNVMRNNSVNLINSIAGQALQMVDSRYNLIKGNTINMEYVPGHESWPVSLRFRGSVNPNSHSAYNRLEENTVTTNGIAVFNGGSYNVYKNNKFKSGQWGVKLYGGSETLFEGNEFDSETGWCVYVDREVPGGNRFINNTFFSGGGSGIFVAINNNTSSLTLRNNIFYSKSGYAIGFDPNFTNFDSDYNLYFRETGNPLFKIGSVGYNTLADYQSYRCQHGGCKDMNSVSGNPLFVNIQSEPYDFHLSSEDSPAVDAGDPDFGNDFPGGIIDIGAYEFGDYQPPQNHPPVLGVIGNQSVNEGVVLTIPLQATDVDSGDILSFSFESNPAINFAQLQDNGDGSASLVINPGYADAGTYAVTVRVADNGSPPLQDSEQFTLTVNDVNRKPVFDDTQTSYTLNVGEPVHLVVRAQDPDTEDTVGITPIMFVPQWLHVVNNQPGNPALIELEGIPDESAMAVDRLVLNAYDNHGFNSYILIVFNINIVNEAPYFYDTQNYYEVPVGGDIQFDAYAKDDNPEDIVTLWVTQKPNWVGYFRWNGNPARIGMRVRPPEGSGGRQYPVQLQAVDNHGAYVYFTITINVPVSQLKGMPQKAAGKGSLKKRR